jgi:hypothetical protein
MAAAENLEAARASDYSFPARFLRLHAPLREFLRPAEIVECVRICVLRSSRTAANAKTPAKK